MNFWDASAIVPLIIQQAFSKEAAKLYEKDAGMIVWWGSLAECESAMARLHRRGELSSEHYDAARKQLAELSLVWMEVKPGDEIRRLAIRLLRVHALRTADAFQLAALLAVASGEDDALAFVCLDQRLRLAARVEGFTVLPVT